MVQLMKKKTEATNSDGSSAKEAEAAAASLAELKLPEGGTEIDAQMSFEVSAVAHAAASKVAEEITCRVKAAIAGSKSALVLFLDERLAAALALHRSFGHQCEVLHGAFESAQSIAEAGATALEASGRRDMEEDSGLEFAPATAAVATAGLSAAVNLLGLLEGTTHYFGREVKVSQQALVMELAREMLGCPGLRFRWPSIGVTPSMAAAPASLPSFEHLHGLAATADRAQIAVHDLAVRVQELPDDDLHLPAARLALDRAHAAHDGAAAILDELRQSFFIAGEDGGDSPAHLLQMADDVMALLDGGDGGTKSEDEGGGAQDDEAESNPADESEVYFLTARIETAGGSYRIRRTFLQLLSGWDPMTFSGGVVVSFALLNRDGDFVAAGTLRERAAYQNFSAASTTFGQERESPC